MTTASGSVLRTVLICLELLLQFSDFPGPMWGSDYVQLSGTPPSSEQKCSPVSWEELKAMDLPSFEPAFLVLCRVLLNVIHECLKLRLEQRPAGEPSLLSIKQVCFPQRSPFSFPGFPPPVTTNSGKNMPLCLFLLLFGGNLECSLPLVPKDKSLSQPLYLSLLSEKCKNQVCCDSQSFCQS